MTHLLEQFLLKAIDEQADRVALGVQTVTHLVKKLVLPVLGNLLFLVGRQRKHAVRHV